uniref:Scavenger receptor class B member 1 n=1 Tax=Steinernema glaseri TaxID=37863 RepID=A0A1I7ZCQ1_9BILA
MRKRSCLCSLAGLFALGVALLVVGLVFALSVIPKDLDARAKKDYVFGTNADGTLNDFTRRWRWRVDSLGNSDSHLEVYMYNYSNVLDVLDLGLRPDVVEVGPYTYRILTDVVSESSENGTFTFSKRRSFIFDAERSCSGCSPQDQFLVPDPIFFGVFVQVGSVEKITEICRQLGDKCQPDLKKLLSSIPSLIGMAVDVFGRYGPFVNVVEGARDRLRRLEGPALRQGDEERLGDRRLWDERAPGQEHDFALRRAEVPFPVATGDGDYLQNGQIIRFETSANVSSGVGTLPEAWWNVTRDDCDPEEARSLYGT